MSQVATAESPDWTLGVRPFAAVHETNMNLHPPQVRAAQCQGIAEPAPRAVHAVSVKTLVTRL